MEEIDKLKADYKKQYPKAEDPFKWTFEFDIIDIIDIMKKRDGKKIDVEYKKGVHDGGTLIYV